MKPTQEGAKIFTGKWNLCLQIISHEPHSKCEVSEMLPKFLVASASTSYSGEKNQCLGTSRRQQRGNNTPSMTYSHRGCGLVNQRAESIYQQVLFDPVSVSTFLIWETPLKTGCWLLLKGWKGWNLDHKVCCCSVLAPPPTEPEPYCPPQSQASYHLPCLPLPTPP